MKIIHGYEYMMMNDILILHFYQWMKFTNESDRLRTWRDPKSGCNVIFVNMSLIDRRRKDIHLALQVPSLPSKKQSMRLNANVKQ